METKSFVPNFMGEYERYWEIKFNYKKNIGFTFYSFLNFLKRSSKAFNILPGSL
jgi:hypothetical protein